MHAGVFFRKCTAETAKQLGIKGWVKNTKQGSVAVEMESIAVNRKQHQMNKFELQNVIDCNCIEQIVFKKVHIIHTTIHVAQFVPPFLVNFNNLFLFFVIILEITSTKKQLNTDEQYIDITYMNIYLNKKLKI
jgi:acylphosphatase